jgi:putative ABC transport system permease protein
MRFDFTSYILIIKSLRRKKMRSFLTSLGIIIGISSVLIIMSVGKGAESLVVNQIEGIGSDLIAILPGAADDEGPPASAMGLVITTLTDGDTKAIVKRVPEIEVAASYLRGVASVTWQNKTDDTSFLGITANYLAVESTETIKGRFINQEEEDQTAKVVVLGYSVAEDLFSNNNPLGEKVKVNKESFRVIGVMEERGVVGFQNQDDQVFVPLTTAQKILMGVNHVSFVRAKPKAGSDPRFVIEQTKQVLRDQHGINDPSKDDFSVRSAEEGLDVLKTVTGAINYFLAMVAAISLIVGGIGIMNIMLVSVAESTKEIGLRKAVGAKQRDISMQFLMQTIILTLLGGVIGIIIGVLISWLVAVVATYLGYDWDFIVTLDSIIMALAFTFVVAISFGWYPAQKAAKLQPVEALRYE